MRAILKRFYKKFKKLIFPQHLLPCVLAKWYRIQLIQDKNTFNNRCLCQMIIQKFIFKAEEGLISRVNKQKSINTY